MASTETDNTILNVDEIDLARADHTDGAFDVALTLGSTLELREVLRRLVEIGRGASDAQHCSLFLLERRSLVPTVAIGRQRDERTWQTFRSLGPVRLDGRRWKLLTEGRLLAIEDAMGSDLIPLRWRRRFQPGAVVLVPLVTDGRPCGLLAIDWAEPRSFQPDQLALLEAVGVAAGVAVRNARLYEDVQCRARLQEALTRGAAALAAPFEPDVIAERLLGSYIDLIGARLCAIGLLDAERQCLTTVAAHGTAEVEGPIPLAEVPPRIVNRAWRSWEQAKLPIEFANEPWFHERLGGREAGADWYLLSPIVVEGHTRGCVLLGFERTRHLGPDERSAVSALADIASAAVERSVLLQRRDRRLSRLDALYRVSAALTERSDANAMIATLRELLAGHGIDVDSVAFCDERLARRLGADALTRRERDVIKADGRWDQVADGAAVVPMRLGQRLFGVLRVRPSTLDAEERAFLEALAGGLAEVAHRDDLRVRIEEAERERALATERERLACDLHDTAGQAFVAAGLLARAHAERLDPHDPSRGLVERLAELSDRGKWDIDQATRALAFAPAVQRGLLPSLRSLARDVQSDSRITIDVVSEGPETRLDTDTERALFRVAHEAIANAWRHARCSRIRVRLVFGAETTVSVADNGEGLPEMFVEGRGIEGMRTALKECEGTLDIAADPSGGTVVEARAPRTTT